MFVTISARPLRVACARGDIANSREPISSSGRGIIASTFNSVIRGASAIIASPSFDNHLATCSGFPTVADNPTFCMVEPLNCSSLDIPTESCHPLSPAANSCTSSIITASTVRSNSLIFEPVNINWNVSGVVIITLGGFLTCFVRSDCLVSPCLSPKVSPTELTTSSSRLSTSRFSARNGVM